MIIVAYVTIASVGRPMKRTCLTTTVAAVMAVIASQALSQTAVPPPVESPPASWRKPIATCEDLAHVRLPKTKISLAETHPAGSFQPPDAKNPFTGAVVTPAPLAVPTFCRIKATLTPTHKSAIEIEIWLPSQGWNEKFLGIGNGGFAGSILYQDLASGIRAGYATVSTDTGHKGGLPKVFEQAPVEVLTDFGWRAGHEMTLTAKKLVSDYYGASPSFSYFSGCSGGGRMALIEAQRFPGDYSGVIAGSAAFSYARVTGEGLWVARTNLRGGSPVLGAAQFALLKSAAMDQCDANDGLKDGEITDPRSCNVQPSKLLCKSGEPTLDCLSAEQVEVAEQLYSGMHNPRNGAVLWTGMVAGSETGYAGAAAAPFGLAQDFYRYMVFKNSDWEYSQLDFGGDVERAEKLTADIIATPDLRAFGRHGGKLIQYASWNENTPPPEDAINYYEAAAAKAGSLAKERLFHKLFLVPNGQHCSGGYATPWFTALTGWVEKGVATDQLIASRLGPSPPPVVGAPPGPPVPGPIVGSRPMCAYPDVPHYSGSGDINSAQNFQCVTAPRGARQGQAAVSLAADK
jgi:feruloyl esterase